jgi:uncharacterized membrane protein
MITSLESLGRPIDEEQLKIPLTAEELRAQSTAEDDAGKFFGEDCKAWKRRTHFIFR